jgi:hypothetical protein
MPRRWWIATLVVLFLASVAGWNLYLAAARPCWHINRERYEQIEKGMNRDEVVALVGYPPGDYTVVKSAFVLGVELGSSVILVEDPPTNPPIKVTWISDAGRITVTFDEGEVSDAEFFDTTDAPARPLAETLTRLFVRGE